VNIPSGSPQSSYEEQERSLRIHGAIARDLGVAIISGKYQPGDVLPGEIAFSEALKISRTAYREAVRILAAKGLVESRPKAGTRVSDRSRWHLLDPDVLSWAFKGEPGEAFIRDLFELRMIVEPAAAELAAERRDAVHLKDMDDALATMAHHGLAKPEGQAADQQFHRAILQAARNAPLAALSSSIEAAVAWTTIFKQRQHALPRDPLPDHRVLLEAIRASDATGARKAMTHLINSALQDTIKSL
jgi:DNA-binding FadR family transcriptional regulator